MTSSAIDILDEAISALEAKLNLPPGGCLENKDKNSFKKPSKPDEPPTKANADNKKKQNKKKEKKPKKAANAPKKKPAANLDQPDICKLEFKVGVITKVWVHPDADKLYCEEIDCGEAEPRRIASGLRLHYTEDEMMGQRLLVVSNLKVRSSTSLSAFLGLHFFHS